MAVLAGIATAPAFADATKQIMTPIDIVQVYADTTADQTIYDRLQVEKTQSYDAIVKDGKATLTIENATLNIDNTFIAREGTTVITGNTTISSAASGSPMLMIGGLNAVLELNGATYTTTTDSNGKNTSVAAIVVGGRDGDGTLKLTNGATLRNNQCLLAGGQSRSANYTNSDGFTHNCGSYVSKTDTSLYRDSQTSEVDGKTIYNNFQDPRYSTSKNDEAIRKVSTADITVEGGSHLDIGYGFNFGNVNMEITGEGTVAEEGWFAVHNTDSNYFNCIGDCVYGGTTVTVKDGATWTLRNNLNISYYGGSEEEGLNGDTVITIGDRGTMNSLRETYFGGTSYGAKAELIIEAGGTANITDASAGFGEIPLTGRDGSAVYNSSRAEDIATLIVKEGGTYAGSSLKLKAASTMTNDGSIVLTAGEKVMKSTYGTVEQTEQVASLLSIEGGKLINNGKVSAETLSITGGTLINAGTLEAQVILNGGTFTMENGAKAAGLTATAGLVSIMGNVTFNGPVQLGAVNLLSDDPTGAPLTINITQGATIIFDDSRLTIDGDTFVIADGTLINVLLVGDGVVEAGESLFTIGYSEAGTPEILSEQLANAQLQLTYDGVNVTASNPGVALSVGSTVSTRIIPEPATATLSLLALMGLAARRRRK